MLVAKVSKLVKTNLTFITIFRDIKKFCDFKAAPYASIILEEEKDKFDDGVKKCASKLIYNSILEKKRLAKYLPIKRQQETKDVIKELQSSLPLSLKYLSEEINVDEKDLFSTNPELMSEESLINFPYSKGVVSTIKTETLDTTVSQNAVLIKDMASEANEEVRKRHTLMKEMKNWMTSYDNFDDAASEENDDDTHLEEWKINYGTPDPNCNTSKVPCGGCGALLHCKDAAIPGYIPSEIFKNHFSKGGTNLQAISCQRCHFLKHFNIALEMQVSPDDYPKVLQTISEKRGVVVLMVDLVDFPCSIWPGIADIFGNKFPIVVVGNKVDLLPKDDKNFLNRVKKNLLDNIKLCGFANLDVKHVALISAKTGFGVEDLITSLNSLYRYKGDVYIVGCTNVGKSSLFNTLLQSDFCKIQAVDLIQRATTSVWPGTTLNLLKFPIKRPAGYRQYLRHQRLQEANKLLEEENRLRLEQLRLTKNPKYATLIGNIEVTKNPNDKKLDQTKDYFSLQGHANASGKLIMGLDENKMEYKYSKWCFDTPGVVQPDQIIHLLTTEELLLTLPKELIMPRTYCVKPGSSLFIGGLSRLDYVDGTGSVKLTVFSSNELPITVCSLEAADEVYRHLLGSDLFKVPIGSHDRLSKWPNLELAQSFKVTGEHWKRSAKDVVLSSTGWIAISGRFGFDYKFQAWTPEKRGVYVRECLLPNAVALSGQRIKHSIAYKKYKFYLK